MAIDFSGCELYLSERSPYARRVRLAFRENGIEHREEVRDVWSENPDLVSLNPIHRVPTLRFRDGRVLIESSLILDLFYRTSGRPLAYRSEEDMLLGYGWSGVALGLIDKTVERFLETLRDERARDPEILAELPVMARRVLSRLEAEIGLRKTLLASGLTQADLDLGTMLSYLRLRFDERALVPYPSVALYHAGLLGRPAFAQTEPLAPVEVLDVGGA